MTDMTKQEQQRQQLDDELAIEDLDVTPEESAELAGGGPPDAATGDDGRETATPYVLGALTAERGRGMGHLWISCDTRHAEHWQTMFYEPPHDLRQHRANPW
jgi:hypothetical protein